MQMLPADQKNETEVLWEDQEKINKFSKLNSRMNRYKEELEKQNKEQEYLSDLQMELELLDEDEKVQYVALPASSTCYSN